MSDSKRFPRIYRGGNPGRQRDDVTHEFSDESEAERTSIRPHKTPSGNSSRKSSTSRRKPKDSARDSQSRKTASSASRDGSSKTRASKDSDHKTTPKHAAGAKGPWHDSFRRSAALTAASAILPGAGLLGAKSRWAKILGILIPSGFLLLLVLLAWQAIMNTKRVLGWVASPKALVVIMMALIIGAIGLPLLIATTHLLTRPRGLEMAKRGIGAGLVVALTFVTSAPLAVGARYTLSQLDLLSKVFREGPAPGQPTIDPGAANPWENTPRVNILLLGADSTGSRIADNKGSYIPRTDTIMVASINTSTGDTALIQIPRNVQHTPFPAGSKLEQLFPRGFRGAGNEQEWFVNAIWERTVSGDMPQMAEAVSSAPYPGAEALKQGVEGITGLHMDYFALVNIDGLQALIDAMGGVKLNVNRKLPIGGDHSTGARPHAWLDSGPEQLLDGYHAMWYARSRFDSSDYDRMARQSCLVNAVIKQANPTTMATSYEAIAQASSEMVMTDIPRNVVEPLTGLALKVKDGNVSRLAFVDGNHGFIYGNPDFAEMRRTVQSVIDPSSVANEPTDSSTSAAPTSSAAPSTAKPSATSTAPSQPAQTNPQQPSETPSAAASPAAEGVSDACAYHPEG